MFENKLISREKLKKLADNGKSAIYRFSWNSCGQKPGCILGYTSNYTFKFVKSASPLY